MRSFPLLHATGSVMISGYNQNATIDSCEIRWTGDTAIAAWGRTDELGANGTLGWDGDREGLFPDNTTILRNLIHELGAFETRQGETFI